LIAAGYNNDCRAYPTGEHLVYDVPDHRLASKGEQELLRTHASRLAGGKYDGVDHH
jgi:hypothetical protein